MYGIIRLTELLGKGRLSGKRAGETLPVLVFGEDQQPPLWAHKKLGFLEWFWLWLSSKAGFWLFNHLGSMLWIKQKEIAVNIEHKEAAVTGGRTFHVQCREIQQRRTLALHSKAVPSFLAPKSHSQEGKELKNSKFLQLDLLHWLTPESAPCNPAHLIVMNLL